MESLLASPLINRVLFIAGAGLAGVFLVLVIFYICISVISKIADRKQADGAVNGGE